MTMATIFVICWLLGSAIGFWMLIDCALREFGKVTLGDALVFAICSIAGSSLPGVVYWCLILKGRDGKDVVLWERKRRQ